MDSFEYKKDDAIFLEGKKSAVCFSIDDISPLNIGNLEGGGAMLNGGLGRVKWLLDRHPHLKVTLFTTANWEEISPVPERKLLAKIPYLRDKFYLAKRLPRNTLRLSRHPYFIKFLNYNPTFEIAYHGLYHCHRGIKIPLEFQDESFEELKNILAEMIQIFDEAGLKRVNGFCPPGWHAPEPLIEAIIDNKIDFIASARDVKTPISKYALTSMSGMSNLPLIYPALIRGGRLVHFATNFQATSRSERAFEIIENGGLLTIKAHIINDSMLDSAKDVYMNYLDMLLSKIEDKYGSDICWTSMGRMSNLILGK